MYGVLICICISYLFCYLKYNGEDNYIQDFILLYHISTTLGVPAKTMTSTRYYQANLTSKYKCVYICYSSKKGMQICLEVTTVHSAVK